MSRAGKYAGVIGNLPALPAADLAYQERVDKTKAAMLELAGGTLSAGTLAAMFDGLRGSAAPVLLMGADRLEGLIDELGKEGIEELLSIVNLRIEAVSQLLQARLDDEGLSTLRLSTGASVSVQYEPY